MGKLIDLTGKKFGRLRVVNRADDYISPKGYVAVNWLCKCDCGNTPIVRGCNLKSGLTKSCGCEKVDHPTQLKHGGKGTRLYKIWKSMRTRCNNPNDKNYRYYGGRGISICREWNDFKAFKDWAMTNGYGDNLTIDRINNNGNYCPENCRWADSTTQANNTRRNHFIEYNGERHTLSEWSRITGISYQKIKDRINKCGWDIKKALTTQ